jgi:UTP--glucose-1-phosphate uridylyltransferase
MAAIKRSDSEASNQSLTEELQKVQASKDIVITGLQHEVELLRRYVMTADLFDCIKRVPRSTRGELQLTDAIRPLLNEHQVYACVLDGVRYDAGDKIGYLKTVIDFALERDDLKRELIEYLAKKRLAGKHDDPS